MSRTYQDVGRNQGTAFRISVYITSYNQKHYLAQAIESVLAQTLLPSQVIIVDDCSTDGSKKVIADYVSRYPALITGIYHARNQGIAQTRIDALRAVTGDYVTYVDGDDRLCPRKLEMEYATLMNDPEAQIAYSNVYFIDADGRRTRLWIDGDTLPPWGYVFREAFGRDFPGGMLFRNELVAHSCLRDVGLYDETLALYEDWDLKIRLAKNFKVAYCPEPLVEYRLHSGGLSKSPASLHLQSVRSVYEKNLPLLDDLPPEDRIMVTSRISIKLADLARTAAREEVTKGNRRRALRYWRQSLGYDPTHFTLRLPVQIILPRWAYRGVKYMYGRTHRDPK